MVEGPTALLAGALEHSARFDTAMLAEAPIEKHDVRRRYDEFRLVGYHWGAALRLAQCPEVDVDDARRLLELGCPEDTALLILL